MYLKYDGLKFIKVLSTEGLPVFNVNRNGDLVGCSEQEETLLSLLDSGNHLILDCEDIDRVITYITNELGCPVVGFNNLIIHAPKIFVDKRLLRLKDLDIIEDGSLSYTDYCKMEANSAGWQSLLRKLSNEALIEVVNNIYMKKIEKVVEPVTYDEVLANKVVPELLDRIKKLEAKVKCLEGK